MLNDVSILNKDSLDFDEFTGGGLIISMELGHNSEWSSGINLEGRSWTEEVGNTSSEWVKIATILITDTSNISVSVTTFIFVVTFVKAIVHARMCSESTRDGIGFPNIHLSATSTPLTFTGVWIRWGWVPSIDVTLSINELDILWALSITISGTILSTSFVLWISRFTSILFHFDEVESSVKTTWQV